jgi:hypothetical protein
LLGRSGCESGVTILYMCVKNERAWHIIFMLLLTWYGVLLVRYLTDDL